MGGADLQGLSSLLLFTDGENAGKEEVDGGEDGEALEEEEEEEEETGTDEDANTRRSLQFSESLPLEPLAD